MRSSACLTVLGLALSIAVGCVKSGLEDDAAADESGDAAETETDDESTDTQPGSDESPSDEAGTGETPSEETGDDETEGDEGEDTNDDPPPTPCKWTNVAIQYGIGDLGQNCGPLDPYQLSEEDLEQALACLQDAYDAEEAAFVTVSWWDGGDNDRKSQWYVRPPKPGKPRRISAQYFRKYAEEGPQPEGKWTVESCVNFALNCEASEFGPDPDCIECIFPATIDCGTKESD